MVFGGNKNLGLKREESAGFDDIIKKWNSYGRGRPLKKILDLTDKEFARIIGSSQSTFSLCLKIGGFHRTKECYIRYKKIRSA